jgi:hypothetical protein
MMKKMFVWVMYVLFVVSLWGCSGPGHMVEKSDKPDIMTVKPDPGKSAIVIARTTNFGGAIEFDTYLDEKMIGVTKKKSYFIKKDVEPGKHYLSTKAENWDAYLINFEKDKVYYFQHEVRMGVWKARVNFVQTEPKKLMDEMEGDCTYYEYNPKDPGENLSASELIDMKEKSKPLN